jgi:predicted dehydrogenase
MDLGIYCVQAVRYTTGLEPVAITAQEGPKTIPGKFSEVEESLQWQMELPGGIIANCSTSYTEEHSLLRVKTQSGWFELQPAYPYEGIKGKTVEREMNFPQVNQQARQMDDFALCIKEGRPTPVPGEEGRQDVKILQAIYQAMRTGERIRLAKDA